MSDRPECDRCIHWRRLKPGAAVGSCLKESSGHDFTNEKDCFPCYQPGKLPPVLRRRPLRKR
jgi:hypothetical protein